MKDRSYNRRNVLKAGTSGGLLAAVLSTPATAAVSTEDRSTTDESHNQTESISTAQIEIEDWHDLAAVREDLAGDYVLVANLDATTAGYAEHIDNSEGGWEPIGDIETPFQGTFDGGTNEISDLMIDRPTEDYVRVFGYLTGTINQFGIRDSTVTGNEQTGLLVGENQGKITQAFSHGTVSGTTNVGGLVGRNARGTVDETYAIASVAGEDIVGGLVGANEDARVVASYAASEVTQLE